ncbi:uncharacterized protein L969DRAFT_88157 [Mixia osmundae IAM 14324]|uniref:Uncharacterized protein n=1 Tax=Mixia osmundae (strain CBS 9802 / IAM 14324 / JCM 22182 / KY 12970) TaxID=764103 RepID=G7E126_MIXOS|nr:uncharacterized protein L969DRAFT_88157 [Mixia osmundae IAM 14324]KEI38828.1 hypothetical protein L969DRAFT_88157 [Mixia osmundae IAM 14324]GAA96536.1 hypothetical protein E5Q_03204 [Mixia osmundae IAM 14324]
MVLLAIRPGALNAFVLKPRDGESLHSLKARILKKLSLPAGRAETEALEVKYEWVGVRYTLDDDDDHETFLLRTGMPTAPEEVSLFLTGDAIPQPTRSPLPGHRPLTSSADGDAQSAYSGYAPSISSAISSRSYSGSPHTVPSKDTSIHLIASSAEGADPDGSGDNETLNGAASLNGTAKTRSVKSFAIKSGLGDKDKNGKPIPQHKRDFEAFHNSRGVRTFIGSIGPVENVRMMMKTGHRNCYMSREFAQQHGFIPKDAAPGFYGFSGITNLGSWPVKVGTKVIQQQVMLIENSYFPIVLGRSFMEKRGVKTDPLDQTSVIFMDTGEEIPTDVVVVKDSNGDVVVVP